MNKHEQGDGLHANGFDMGCHGALGGDVEFAWRQDHEILKAIRWLSMQTEL